MGAFCSKGAADEAANNRIDMELKQDQNRMRSEVKLLLLGAHP